MHTDDLYKVGDLSSLAVRNHEGKKNNQCAVGRVSALEE